MLRDKLQHVSQRNVASESLFIDNFFNMFDHSIWDVCTDLGHSFDGNIGSGRGGVSIANAVFNDILLLLTLIGMATLCRLHV